jgi:hypothetical protein
MTLSSSCSLAHSHAPSHPTYKNTTRSQLFSLTTSLIFFQSQGMWNAHRRGVILFLKGRTAHPCAVQPQAHKTLSHRWYNKPSTVTPTAVPKQQPAHLPSRKLSRNQPHQSPPPHPPPSPPNPAFTSTTADMPRSTNPTDPAGPVYFWKPAEGNGYLGQWYPSEFTHAGDTYATAEMWMMVQKARLFGDEEIAKQMLGTVDPKAHRALGRKVEGFDGEKWDAG